jgi:hypothetical protein
MKKRFLGIELGGARRTAIVALDFFSSENKVFLAKVESPLSQEVEETPDEQIVRIVNSFEAFSLGVDAPLSLPPCVQCEKDCEGARLCKKESSVWMRNEAKRQKWGKGKLPLLYAQRPVDLLLRGDWQEEAITPFPVDDSFGSSRAPLAIRMQYLKSKLHVEKMIEVNPRFSLGELARVFGLSSREVRKARDVEDGLDQRFTILESLSQPRKPLPHLFLYNSDISALAQNLSAFDALICGYMAILQDARFLEKSCFPESWGNVAKVHTDLAKVVRS